MPTPIEKTKALAADLNAVLKKHKASSVIKYEAVGKDGDFVLTVQIQHQAALAEQVQSSD